MAFAPDDEVAFVETVMASYAVGEILELERLAEAGEAGLTPSERRAGRAGRRRLRRGGMFEDAPIPEPDDPEDY
jgi:hypothetical protein